MSDSDETLIADAMTDRILALTDSQRLIALSYLVGYLAGNPYLIEVLEAVETHPNTLTPVTKWRQQ